MKIEIGESIVASYFKHVRGCQIVQTNFKASPSWKIHNQELAEKRLERKRNSENKIGYSLKKQK